MRKEKNKRVAISILIILLSAIAAIAIHIVVPTPAGNNTQDFNSIPVKIFSFSVVATFYFIVLSTHIYAVVLISNKCSSLNPVRKGLLIGGAFSMIYLVGMQEVVVSASPFSEYGIDFIVYQMIIGFGDAVPAMLSALCLSYVNRTDSDKAKIKISKGSLRNAALISAVFIIVRFFAYYFELDSSDISEYPIPVIIWTILFGGILGAAYLMLATCMNVGISNVMAFGLLLGLNWIWFNLFIGLVFDGLFVEMLIRGMLDIVPGMILLGICDIHRNKKQET